MKTALQIAMERFGSSEETGPALTTEQKAALAQIEKVFEARAAEKKILLQQRIDQARAAGEYAKVEELRQELAAELAKLNRQKEREKQKVRKGEVAEEESVG